MSGVSAPASVVFEDPPAEVYERRRLRRRVGATAAATLFLLTFWFGLLTLTALPGAPGFGDEAGDGTAAGAGGLGRAGWGGTGLGYDGTGDGGGGGKGGDPVNLTKNTLGTPAAGDPDPAADGEDTAPSQGESFASLSRKKGTLGFTINPVAEPQAAQGEAAPDTGAGAGNEGSEFFGVRSRGKNFVYVVDCSGSMAGPPYQRATQELVNSISKLKANQSFYVILFDDIPHCQFNDPGPPPKLMTASRTNKRNLVNWVNATGIGGGTNPEQSLLWAIALEPSAIYLLTDGGFDPGIVQRVTAANKRHVPINTIAFVNPIGEPLLREIAQKNRGKYVFRP